MKTETKERIFITTLVTISLISVSSVIDLADRIGNANTQIMQLNDQINKLKNQNDQYNSLNKQLQNQLNDVD